MANKIIIKNGAGAPPANALSVAELGFDTANKKVYIGHGDGPIEMGPPDLKIDINGSISGDSNIINADALGGVSADKYAKIEYVNAKIAENIPAVTASDNGKFLRVVDGAWSAVNIPIAEEAGF